MALNARDFTFPGQWAKGASTTIPPIPPSGFPYRNASMSQAIAENGQNYDTVADSAIWNQILYLCSGMAMENEIYGWPRWSPLTNYIANASFCLGADGIPYRAILDSGPATVAGPQDPATTTGYWLTLGDFIGQGYWLLKRLTANLSIYVNGTTGDDATADGTQERPFKTIGAALLYVANNFHLSTYNVTIRVAAGTYPQAINLPLYMTTTGSISIIGNSVTDTIINCTSINAQRAITLDFPSTYTIDNFQVLSSEAPSVSYSTGIGCSDGTLILGNMSVAAQGTTNSIGLWAAGGRMILGNGTTASSKAISIAMKYVGAAALNIQGGSRVSQTCNMTMSGTVNIASIQCTDGSAFDRSSTMLPNVSGTIAGRRYAVWTNAIINTYGGGANYFPGNSAGETFFGGQYA